MFNETLSFDLSILRLEQMIAVFFSKNQNIRPGLKSKIHEFYMRLDKNFNDATMNLRLSILNRIIARYQQTNTRSFNDFLEIFEKSSQKTEIYDVLHDIFNDIELSTKDVKFISTYVTERLTYDFIYKLNPTLNELTSKFEVKDFMSLPELLNKYGDVITNIHNSFRDVRKSLVDETYVLNSTNMTNILMETQNELKSPSSIIRTGSKALNGILNGGFRRKKSYLFVAISGKGKSKALLHTNIWATKYNDLKAKDPTKKPFVLYVTLENSKTETVERLVNYIDPSPVVDMDIHDMNNRIVEELRLDKADLMIKYYPSNSISTTEIADIYDEELENGREMVMVAIDYVKRMIPSKMEYRALPIREKLGAIGVDLNNLAKEKDIAVVSAAQLNRKAEEEMARYEITGLVDLIKALNRSQIAESKDLIDESDDLIIIHPEKDPDDSRKEYLAFKKGKTRGKEQYDIQNTFYIPFEEGNGMRLMEDVDTEFDYSFSSMNEVIAGGNNGGDSGASGYRVADDIDDVFK